MTTGAVVRVLGPGPRWYYLMSYPGIHFELLVDGDYVTDVWPGKVAVAEVSPGVHAVRLRRPFLRVFRSPEIEIATELGKTVELGCGGLARFVASLVPDIQPASEKQIEMIRRSVPDLPPPRDLRRADG